jgi:short-subunit dehydrogenase
MPTSLKNRIVFITGVSSGIGREIAQLLAERGARVFGTVRDSKSANTIPGVEMVRMDVTEDASVNEAVQSVVQKVGPVQILVNNAGYSLMGSLEETSLDEARQQFETNFFGVLRVTSAVLPMMRQASYGRIVNISSVVGFIPAPYMGIYTASKHAVEGYTETLDHEVREFGVRAVLVEPALTKSKLSHNERTAGTSIKEYAVQRQRVKELVQKGTSHGDEPRLVAEAVWKAVTVKSPRLRYPVGKGVLLSRLRRFVPAGVFDRAIRKQTQLA